MGDERMTHETRNSPPGGNSAGVSRADMIIEMSAMIIAAYVSRHNIMPGDLPGLITDVGDALGKIAVPETNSATSVGALAKPTIPTPAVPILSSVTAEAIICLEDGKPFKSLRRHLKTSFNLTADEYREKWGLPPDYPMVAPNYAAQRSELAKRIGLGIARKKAYGA